MDHLRVWNTAIIGGADGPTDILLASPIPIMGLLAVSVGVVLMAVIFLMAHHS